MRAGVAAFGAASLSILLAGTAVAQGDVAPEGYVLVWSDEFDAGPSPDPLRWTYDVDRNRDGWWNDEAQYYSADRLENARLEDGLLVIEARRDDVSGMADFGGQPYSSARLSTRGLAAWTYGFFDIRARLPCGRGQWPAIWLLGTGEWPDTGEIDIMEAVGHRPEMVYANFHSLESVNGGIDRSVGIRVADRCDAFHHYQLEWTPQFIVALVDGVPYNRLDRPRWAGAYRWPFDRPEYLILNVAVGGTWGGEEGIDDTAFPARMEVDHVRIYQQP